MTANAKVISVLFRVPQWNRYKDGKIGNISHPGHVEIFRSHRKICQVFLSHRKFTCFNIILCNRLLKYHFLSKPGKIYIFCFRSSYYNTIFPFYNLFYHTYASLVVNISHISSHSCLCITLSALSNLFLFRWPP